MKDRKNIDLKYTWDLEKIYKTLDDFYFDYDKLSDMIGELSNYENNMMDSANSFYNAIKLSFDIERLLDKLYTYSNLLFDLDTSNNSNQELCEKVDNKRNEYETKSYFIVPSILKCDKSIIDKYYEEEKNLISYKKCIDEIYRYKDHTLSDDEERLMSSVGTLFGNYYNTYELFKDCDMSFGDIKDEKGNTVNLNNSNYSLYIDSKNRDVRRDAFVTMYKEYKKYSNTFASLLSNHLKEISLLSRIKKYNSSLEMALYADSVDTSIYDTLITSVRNNIDIVYDYYKLKKNILGLDELHLYDVYTPIVEGYDKKYDFEEAKDIILKVLEVFGDEYISKVKEGLDSRWVDVYPTKNKRTGGYSGGSYDTYPYILLNYQDKYSDMSTLIHEMGHSMHSYYSRQYNTYQDSEYRIFAAEVASTVNELLLSYYLLEHSNDSKEKLFILNNLLELYRSTIIRQTMFEEFERELSKLSDNMDVLTSDKICNIYYDLNKFYFGPDVCVDEEIRYEWERVPHFYYNFYVYKYATGLSAATIIVKNILSGKEDAVSDYIEFLKCGSKLDPVSSLKVAGVDLFDTKVYDIVFEEFKRVLDMYKEISK